MRPGGPPDCRAALERCPSVGCDGFERLPAPPPERRPFVVGTTIVTPPPRPAMPIRVDSRAGRRRRGQGRERPRPPATAPARPRVTPDDVVAVVAVGGLMLGFLAAILWLVARLVATFAG